MVSWQGSREMPFRENSGYAKHWRRHILHTTALHPYPLVWSGYYPHSADEDIKICRALWKLFWNQTPYEVEKLELEPRVYLTSNPCFIDWKTKQNKTKHTVLRHEDHVYETFRPINSSSEKTLFFFMATDGIPKHNQLHFKCLQLVQSGTRQECEWFRPNLFPLVEKSLSIPLQLMFCYSNNFYF